MLNRICIAGAIALWSTGAAALETKTLVSGPWVALQFKDEFTHATACSVARGFGSNQFINETIAFNVSRHVISDGGQYVDDKPYLITHQLLGATDEAKFLIDSALTDPSNWNSFIGALKKGHKMTFRWKDPRGNIQTETVSLIGFTKAWDAASKACPPSVNSRRKNTN